jgi:hypothetical protein
VAAPRLVPVQYEWFFNGAVIAGATTNSLVIDNAEASKLGTYAVRVIAGTATQAVDRLFAATLSFPMADSDNDGMPDDWESAHTCLSGTTADAAGDADQDSMLNLSEYLAGTNPCDRESYLKAELVRTAGLTNVALRFNAVSNRTYSILYQDALGGTNAWRVLQDVQVPNSQAVQIQDPQPASATRFYRLVTPRMQ